MPSTTPISSYGGNISGGLLTLGAGSLTVGGGSITLGGDTGFGVYRNAANQWSWFDGGVTPFLSIMNGLVRMQSTQVVGWTSGNSQNNSDATISRNAAGVVQVGTTGLNASGQLLAAVLRTGAVAFASVPGTAVEGMMVAITDSSTATWGATITGGGANHVLGYYNGTNWTVAAK